VLGTVFLVIAGSIGVAAYRQNSEDKDPFAKCSEYFNKNAYQDAIDCYKKSGNLGDNYVAKKQLGQSLAAVGRRLEAGQTVRAVFERNPDAIRPLISIVYVELAINEYDQGNKHQAIRYQAILRAYDEAMADKLKVRFEQ
jgi:tetratricopeptide (TPR) repeat protein